MGFHHDFIQLLDSIRASILEPHLGNMEFPLTCPQFTLVPDSNLDRGNTVDRGSTCGAQSTSCILFIYAEYGKLFHLNQALTCNVHQLVINRCVKRMAHWVKLIEKLFSGKLPFVDYEIPRNLPKLEKFQCVAAKDMTT